MATVFRLHFQSHWHYIMTGIGDQCVNRGVKQFTEQLSEYSGAEGFCVYGYLPLIASLFYLVESHEYRTIIARNYAIDPW